MHEAEIRVPQPTITRVLVGVLRQKLIIIVTGALSSNQIGANQKRGGRAKDIKTTQQSAPANLASGNDGFLIGEPVPTNFVAAEAVGADDTHRRIRFGESNHFSKAFRKQPIVGVEHFTVLTVRADLPKRDIVIFRERHKAVIIQDAEAAILLGIALRDL